MKLKPQWFKEYHPNRTKQNRTEKSAKCLCSMKWPFQRHTERLYIDDKKNVHLQRLVSDRHPQSPPLTLFPANSTTSSFASYSSLQNDHRQNGQAAENEQAVHEVSKQQDDIESIIHRFKLHDYATTLKLLSGPARAPITTANRVTVLTDGSATFDAALRAMESAEHHIHFQMYIFHADKTGWRVMDVMMRKARQGVEVRVLVDAIGGLSSRAKAILRDAGVHVATWFPLRGKNLRMKKLQHRNHRKIICVDGVVGFLGGMNWSDMYDERLNPHIGWRDSFVQIRGNAVSYLQAIFLDDFEYAMQEQIFEAHGPNSPYFPFVYSAPTQHISIATAITTSSSNSSNGSASNPIVCPRPIPIQIVASGPDSRWRFAHQLLFMAITSARSSLLISSPYIALDDSLMMALKTAALSGVKVHLVTQGKFEKHNLLVYLCGRGYHDEFLKYGIRVYRYRAGIFHTKSIVVDQQWAVIGSINMDFRSFDCCFEVASVIYDKQVADRLAEDFWRDVKRSREVTRAYRDRTKTTIKAAEYLLKKVAPYVKL